MRGSFETLASKVPRLHQEVVLGGFGVMVEMYALESCSMELGQWAGPSMLQTVVWLLVDWCQSVLLCRPECLRLGQVACVV